MKNNHTRAGRRRVRTAGAVFLLLTFLLSGGCKKNEQEAAAMNPEAAAKAPPREFSVEAFGVVTAPRAMTVTGETGGMVQTVHAKRGDRITGGKPVITLDIRDYVFELQSLQNSLDAALLRRDQLEQDTDRADSGVEQDYKRLTNQITITETELDTLRRQWNEKNTLLNEGRDPDIEKLKSDLAKARLDYEDAAEDLEQNMVLYRAEAISEQELKNAEAAVKTLENQIRGLEFSLEKLVLTRDDELDSLALQISQKETSLDNLKIERDKLSSPSLTALAIQELEIAGIRRQIENHRALVDRPWFSEGAVVCPYDQAIVSEIHVQEGERISAGTRLVTFLDGSAIEVEGYVPEEFIRDISVGDDAAITPVADANRSYQGAVQSIATLAIVRNNETVVPVTISVDNADGFLIPNFNVDISFKPEKGDEEPVSREDAAAARNRRGNPRS